MFVFTSCANNYIPKARVLASSLKTLHPDWTFCLLLGENPPPGLHLPDEPFDRLLGFDELGIENYPAWLFRHRVVEICTAAKGPALYHFLEREQRGKVMYLDPDIMVMGSLAPLEALLDDHALLLTPHQRAPQTTPQSIVDNELCSMQFGVFNLGFVAAARRGDGLAFAAWWRDRLLEYCYDDRPRGLFTDQRWCDLAPTFFPDLHIVRDPGCNAASWNLTDRTITRSPEGEFLAEGGPLRFYHFTGFDSGAGDSMVERYAKDMPAVHELWAVYREKLMASGQDELGKLPWSGNAFSNGAPVTDAMRLTYRNRPDVQAAFPDPYAVPGYRDWFLAEQGGPRQALPTRAWRKFARIYRQARPVLDEHGGFPKGIPGLTRQSLQWARRFGLLGMLRKIWSSAGAPEPSQSAEASAVLRDLFGPGENSALAPSDNSAPSPLAALFGSAAPVCVLEHDWGGGAQAYGDALVQKLLDEGQAVVRLRSDTPGRSIRLTALYQGKSLSCRVPDLRELGDSAFPPISRFIANELCGWHYRRDDPAKTVRELEETLGVLADLVRRHKARLEVLFHDFYALCPTMHLVTPQLEYCGLERSEAFCDACGLRGLPFSMGRWRAAWGDLLALADELIFFSQNTCDLARKVYPLRPEQIVIRPHSFRDFGLTLRIAPSGPMTIAVVGAIEPHKGKTQVLALAELLQQRCPEASILVFGNLTAPSLPGNITVLGEYKLDDLPLLLARHKVTAGFFPSVCPETFSFVLHELASLGLPLAAFDLGAQGDYVKTLPNSRVISDISPEAALEALLELDAQRRI
jgi:glycosyltransferase involved in cell wall biosynthesis